MPFFLRDEPPIGLPGALGRGLADFLPFAALKGRLLRDLAELEAADAAAAPSGMISSSYTEPVA